MPDVILTSAGKLGDFLYALPIASWLHKTRGQKTHWVLPGSFDPFNYISSLLMFQSFTSKVSIVPYKILNYDCGGQPYRFDPYVHGLAYPETPTVVYNLGFRYYPDKYLSAFYAEEHDLDYERDYRFDMGWQYRAGSANYVRLCPVFRSTEGAMAKLVPDAKPLPTNSDLLELVRMMAGAKEVHTWYCGLAVLCYFAGIPVIVHRMPGHAAIDLYFEGDYSHVKFVEHTREEIEG